MVVRHGRDEHTFDQPLQVRVILRKLGIVPEGVIVSVNGDLVTNDTLVRVGDEVEIIRAISGGQR